MNKHLSTKAKLFLKFRGGDFLADQGTKRGVMPSIMTGCETKSNQKRGPLKLKPNLFWYLIFMAIFGVLSICNACYYDNKEDLYQFTGSSDCMITEVSYVVNILPILNSHCMSCHSAGNPQGGVDLEGYSKVQARANDGSLYGSINHVNSYVQMPPGGQKIPRCEIQAIKTWVDAGAQNN